MANMVAEVYEQSRSEKGAAELTRGIDILKQQIDSVRPMRLEMDERGRAIEVLT